MKNHVIMKNGLNSPQVGLSSPVQIGKQDIFSKIYIILDNSDLDSLLSFLDNQLNHIGLGKLDGKFDKELKTYYFNIEVVIKKIIDNKDFIAEIIGSKLSGKEYKKTKEILELASRINPDILEETGIGEVLLEIEKNKENKKLNSKNQKLILKNIYTEYIKGENNIVSLSPEILMILKEDNNIDDIIVTN